MFINEDGNDEAHKAFEMVLKQVTENPSIGFLVDVKRVDGNRTEPKEFLKNCE